MMDLQQPPRPPKRGRAVRLVVIGMFIPLVSMIAAESLSWLVLRSRGLSTEAFLVTGRQPFQRKLSQRLRGISPGPITLDSHLGYGLEPSFTVYGVQDSQAKRILALGGSTTDPGQEGNWPQTLSVLLANRGIKAQIFNGGVGGYSSNQEVIKLIRDGIPVVPHIVISLNGVNDLGFIWSKSPETPMVNPVQRDVFDHVSTPLGYQSVFLPNTAALIWAKEKPLSEPTWGWKINLRSAQQWERNVRIMRSVSEAFGIEYLCALQPIMGFGKYSPSPEEERMWEEQKNRMVHGIPYPTALETYYREAQAACAKIPYCMDLTAALSGKQGLFQDPRHPNPKGYKVIAQAILQELESRGLLDP